MKADRATPLIRSRVVRVLIAAGLTLGGVGVFALAWTTLLILFAPLWAIGALTLAATAPFAAWPIIRGRWAREEIAGAQQGAALWIGLVGTVVAGVSIHHGFAAAATRDDLGTPASEAVIWFALATVALAGVASLVAALPVARRFALGTVLAFGFAALCSAAVAAANADDDECESFRVDPERWRIAQHEESRQIGDLSDIERMAEAIERCGSLDGLTRAQVRELIGSNRYAGTINDGLGPGDASYLHIRYGRDGRVKDVSVD